MSRHTVIITGATRGLGRAISLTFAGAGHRVIGLYSQDEAAAVALRAKLNVLAGDSLVLKHDISLEDAGFWQCDDIQQAANLVLINNACAAFTPHPLHLLRWEDFDRALNVAVKGSWLCACAVARPMARAGHGTIINILTAAIRDLPPKGFAAYVTAKHALRGLTLALAAEYEAKGIRVFSVSPGFMATSLTASWDARLGEAIRASTPASEPDKVARQIFKLVENPATAGQGRDYPA